MRSRSLIRPAIFAWARVWAALLVVPANLALASESQNAQIPLTGLAFQRTWLRLVHYEPVWYGGYRSSARSDSFFLAKDGRQDTAHELEATIHELFQASTKYEMRCRFPARYEWLRHIHSIGANEPSTLDRCQELTAWRRTLNARSLSLVNPESSLESSISVFSHTFLKINSAHHEPQSRLHQSISFAASFKPSDNLLKLAFYGVFGGYDGKYGTDYYYEDVIRYGVRESRDIFEYELNLSPAQVEQVLNHVWETRDTKFDYLFLNKNCSYFLLTLLEIGRDDLDLSAQFANVTVPIETVKAVYREPGLVTGVRYFPSRQRENRLRLEKLSAEARMLYRELMADPTLIQSWTTSSAGLQQPERSAVLDAVINTWTDDRYADWVDERRLALRYRAQAPAPVAAPETDALTPESYPHQFHGSQLLGLSLANRSDENGIFTMFRYRFVFHDILNSDSGAVHDTTVEAFDVELQLLNSQLAVYRTTLFNILSLQPFNINGNATWLFRSRWQHDFENRGGFGLSYFRGPVRGFTLALAQSANRNILNTSIWSGAELGAVLMLTPELNAMAELGYLLGLSYNQSNKSFFDGTLNWKYRSNQELRLIYERDDGDTLAKFSLQYFF